MEEEIGKVTHYYEKIGVVVVELSGSIKINDRIAIKGKITDFEQNVGSIQIEHNAVESAKSGDAIGLKVEQRAVEGDTVYRLS